MHQPRSGVRIPVELPARVRWKSPRGGYRQTRGKTENISGNGLFVAMPERLRLDTSITVTVTLPAMITKIPLVLCCQGRVRRWSQPGELRGIGAVIDDYEFRSTPPRV